jgi:FkbM family methyltransferase
MKAVTVETDLPESDVACTTIACTDCCERLSPFLTEEELYSGNYIYTFINTGDDKPAIAIPRTNAGCVYLSHDKNCTIYDRRPKSCRQFDCRTPETSHPSIRNRFEQIKEISVLGLDFKLKLHKESELFSDIIRQYGSPDIDDITTYCGVLSEGDIYFDIGANIGFNAIFASILVGKSGKVYAFEPEQANYDLLLENILLNNITNIIPVKCAVLNENKISTIYKSKTNYGDHIVDLPEIFQTNNHINSGEINSITLDKFVESIPESEMTKLKLIKIDTQGSDIKVLEGALKLIKRYKPDIIIEYSPHHLGAQGYSPFELLSFIDKNKYTPYKMSYHHAADNGSNPLIPLSLTEIINITSDLAKISGHIDLFLKG